MNTTEVREALNCHPNQGPPPTPAEKQSLAAGRAAQIAAALARTPAGHPALAKMRQQLARVAATGRFWLELGPYSVGFDVRGETVSVRYGDGPSKSMPREAARQEYRRLLRAGFSPW